MKAHQDLADFARLLIVNSWQISILKGDRKDSYGANFPLRCVASKGGAFGLFINVSNPCPRRLRPHGTHPARTQWHGPVTMPRKIVWTDQAKAQLRAIDQVTALRILALTDGGAEGPPPQAPKDALLCSQQVPQR